MYQRFHKAVAERNEAIVPKWSFVVLRIHPDLFSGKWFSRFDNYFNIKYLINIFLSDLLASANDLARFEIVTTFPPVSVHHDDLVHLPESHFRLQAPLVGRFGGRHARRSVCPAGGQLRVRPV